MFDRGSSGRSIVVMYKLDTHYAAINALEVIATDGSFPPRRLTPAPAPAPGAAAQYELVSEISPDGRWVVFKELRSGSADRYFLADLTQNGATTELTLPAGAISLLGDYGSQFGPGSQYYYAPAEFEFPNFKRGSAIYRYAVASPAAAPQLVSPAAREDVSVGVTRISPDEARILFTEFRQGEWGSALRILTIADPSAAVTLSHTFAAQERISGFIHTNAQFSRVYYPTEEGIDPNYTFRLYGADTAIAGSASLITDLPADEWRPEIWELSPDETSVLISAPFRVSGQLYNRASTLALTPGAQPHVVVPQHQGLNLYNFIDAGRFVLYAESGWIYRVPVTGVPNPVPVASKSAGIFSLSPDGAYVATPFRDPQVSPANSHLWLANTMSTGGLQQVEFSGVGDATAYVSTWGFIPAQ
jgi:hypothetical protein